MRAFCGHSPCYGVFWGTRARHLGSTRRASLAPGARAAAHQAQAGASRCFRRSEGVPEGLKLVPARSQ